MQPEKLRRGAENALLALLYYHFADVHWQQATMTHRWWPLAPIVVQETLLATMFLTRRASRDTSMDWKDWAVGIAGTFLPLLIRPGWTSFAFGPYLQLVGLGISIAALLSLNRSIGIVAANRGIKTGGVYGIVRHPMYAGHLIVLLGYSTTYPSPQNLLIVVATMVCLKWRMDAEERLLKKYLEYFVYYRCVKWRVIPGVY